MAAPSIFELPGMGGHQLQQHTVELASKANLIKVNFGTIHDFVSFYESKKIVNFMMAIKQTTITTSIPAV